MATLLFAVVVLVLIAIGIIGGIKHDEEQASREAQIICPHCQVKGRVRTTPVEVKKGISGAKATGALLTGGLSVMATGLSKKEAMTEAHCSNCGQRWQY